MTAGYDEWAAARTPSLLAFAMALVADEPVADAAVSRALTRVGSDWPRASRHDPDLEARRYVIRACATSAQGAAVLRLLEERSDIEIAEVLGCSEFAARRHVRKGLTAFHPDPDPDPDADDPAAKPVARHRLEARAGAAPAQLLNRPPATGPGTTETGRGHGRGAWLGALVVLVLIVGVAVVAHATRTPDGEITYSHVSVPKSWRFESYDGVQVQVPDAWGWGGAPIRSSVFPGPRHLGSCGANQAEVLSPADHAPYVSTLTGFVGRPAFAAESCTEWGSDGTMPEGDALWFGSPMPVGVKAVGGLVAETRAVGAQHLTVFSDDPTLRREILGSADQVGVDAHGCPTKAVTRPSAGPRDVAPGSVSSLSVCVYSQDTGESVLQYSETVNGDAAQEYADHAASAGTPGGACPTLQGRWVALGLHVAGGTRWDVVNLGCERIQLAGGGAAQLTPDTVRDWAVDGVRAYVTTPAGDHALDSFFRAPRTY
jgi:hypothetical protein